MKDNYIKTVYENQTYLINEAYLDYKPLRIYTVSELSQLFTELEKIGITCYITHGTLLKFIRDEDPLADDDIDVGIVRYNACLDERRLLVYTVIGIAEKFDYVLSKYDEAFTKFTILKKGAIPIDICIYHMVNADLEPTSINSVLYTLKSRHKEENKIFHGLFMPVDWQSCLCYWYGNDWNLKKNYKSERERVVIDYILALSIVSYFPNQLKTLMIRAVNLCFQLYRKI